MSVKRVLLLPGLDGTGRLFAPLQAELAEDLETTAIRYTDERVFEEYLQTVAGRMADTGNILMAESFSGPIALALLSRFPSRIRCAVLCATFAVSPFRNLCHAARLVPVWSFRSSPLRRSLIRHFGLNGELHHSIVPEVIDAADGVPGVVTKSRLSVLSQVNMLPLLSGIQHPILILQASHDRVVSRRLGRQLIDGLPRAQMRIIEGPHMLMQTRPAECATAIRDFLHTL